ncbi:glycosyltransferase family 2 protein, partial [Streptococcus pyogenes]
SDCSRIRVDLSEIPSFFQRVSLVSMRSGTEILPCFTNAIILGSAYIFPNSDPQITYNIPVELFGREFQLNYAVFELDDI